MVRLIVGFLALCSKQQWGPSLLRNPSQRDPQCTPAIWHASQSQSQGTSYLRAIIRVLMCVKQSFDGTAFTCGFHVEKGCRSQYFDKTGLWRNALLVNQTFWFLQVRNDVTCFSNGCCNVVGRLVETALWPLSFAWKVLGGIVSPTKTQGSP